MVSRGRKKEENRFYNRLIRRFLPAILWNKINQYSIHPLGRMKNKLFRENRMTDLAIHGKIAKDFHFVEKFISDDPSDWQEIEAVVAASSSD